MTVEYRDRFGKPLSESGWKVLVNIDSYKAVRHFRGDDGFCVYVTWVGLVPGVYEVWMPLNGDKLYYEKESEALSCYEDYLVRHNAGEYFHREDGSLTFMEIGNTLTNHAPVQSTADTERAVAQTQDMLNDAKAAEIYGTW